jgi:hypothetical protein
MRVDGSGKRRLAEGRSPQLSPDGRWVAFQGGRCDSGYCPDLLVIASGGGTSRLLSRGTHDPVWAPDSRRLVAAEALSAERLALISVELNGGTPITLARGAFYGWDVSPDGGSVVFAHSPRWGLFSKRVNLYRVEFDGDDRRRLTRDGESAYPAWGPNEIAYAHVVAYRGWGAHELWLLRPDGERRRLLAKTPRELLGSGITGLKPAEWSSDGRVLLAGLSNEFGAVPYVVDVASGNLRAVGRFDFHSRPDGLSADGRLVLVEETGVEVDDAWRIEVVPLRRGKSRILARRAAEASWNR